MGKEQKKLSVEEKVKILDRRISFIGGILIAQSALFISIVGIIISIKDTDNTFFKFMQNQYILGIIVFIEIWILYFLLKKAFNYLKTIEKLNGITGHEDFLK